MWRPWWWLCVVLLAAVPRAEGKVTTGLIQLTSTFTESYVTKFSFSQRRNGYITGRFYTLGSTKYFEGMAHDLTIALFDDVAWEKFHAAFSRGSLCRERRELATWTHRVRPSTTDDPHNPEHGEDFFFEVEVPTVEHRAHYWYAVMMDCQLEQYDAHPAPIVYEMKFMNGNSHLPADEEGLPEVMFTVLLLLVCFGVFVLYGVMSQWYSVHQIHLIVVMFAFAYLAQTVAVGCEFVHLYVYSGDGRGLRLRHTWLALDFMADVLQQVSELIISIVLVCLSFGWTLASPMTLLNSARAEGKLAAIFSHPADAGACIVFLTIFFVQVVLQLLGRQHEDDFTQFHDYEHVPGYALLTIRLLLCFAFWVGTMSTIRNSRNADVSSFLGKLTFIGSFYFLAFPAVVASTAFMAPYNRHAVVTGGSLTLQSLALGLFLKLFLSKSEYYKISSLSRMGTLFGTDLGLVHASKLATD